MATGSAASETVNCAHVWGGRRCDFSFVTRGYTHAGAVLWLLRAHWWEAHGGKKPEGL